MESFKFLPEGWKDEVVQLQKVNENIVNGEILQGIVETCDEQYNLQVPLGKGIVGIMPREEIEGINVLSTGVPKENLCTGKVHKYIQFKVKEVNEEGIPILTRKQVQQEALQSAMKNLQIGQLVKGIVKSITTYGAFIEIGGGVAGLIHIEDLSVARIKTPFERLQIGQKVEVVVKSIYQQEGKINLSYKENFGTWEENIQKFSLGQKTQGIVREVEKNKNGIFIELSPNLVGMIEYQEGLQYGQKVDIAIKKIDWDRKKVKLILI